MYNILYTSSQRAQHSAHTRRMCAKKLNRSRSACCLQTENSTYTHLGDEREASFETEVDVRGANCTETKSAAFLGLAHNSKDNKRTYGT